MAQTPKSEVSELSELWQQQFYLTDRGRHIADMVHGFEQIIIKLDTWLMIGANVSERAFVSTDDF